MDELTPFEEPAPPTLREIEDFAETLLSAAKRYPRYDFSDLRDFDLWALQHLATHGRHERTRLRAREVLARLNPEFAPRGDTSVTVDQRSLTIVWDGTAREIAPPSAGSPTVPNSIASAGSNGSASSSAIADGEKPPSA